MLPTEPPEGDRGGPDDGAEMLGGRIRPYMITGGRTAPARAGLELETLVQAAAGDSGDADVRWRLRPEQRDLLALCDRRPVSIAEVGAGLGVPVNVARILVNDLADQALLVVHDALSSGAGGPDEDVLQRVLRGLRALH